MKEFAEYFEAKAPENILERNDYYHEEP